MALMPGKQNDWHQFNVPPRGAEIAETEIAGRENAGP